MDLILGLQSNMENTTIVCVVGQSEVVRAKLVIKDFANIMVQAWQEHSVRAVLGGRHPFGNCSLSQW